MVRKLGDIEQIVVHAAHQIAHFVVVVKRRRHLHEFAVQFTAQVGLELGAHDVPHRDHKIAASRFDQFDGHHYTAHRYDHAQRKAARRLQPPQQFAHEHGKSKPRQRVQQRAKQIQYKRCFIRLVIR